MAVGQKRIVSFTRGGTICSRLTIADSALPRMRGLLGRRSLAADEGMLLRPERAIHTAFMRFPIDALFLDRDMEVLEIASNLRPWRAASSRGAYAILELAAGEAQRLGIRAGDHLGVVDSDLELPFDVADFGNGKGAADEEADRDAAISPTNGANGRHSGAIRVLLMARDRRFRTVTAALLTRRGCEVSAAPVAARLPATVTQGAVDVVVLEAGSMLTAAARTVAMIEALDPPIGVVLVAEEAEQGLRHLPVLAKWGPFDDVYAAVEKADRDRGRRSRLVG